MDPIQKVTLLLLGVILLLLLFLVNSALGAQPCTSTSTSTVSGQSSTEAYYGPNETGRTIQTSEGNLLQPSSSLGRPSSYIDTSGRTRDVTCYAMEYCIECPRCEEECVQEGNQCGYGQTPLTNLAANAPFYGDCCDGLACREGYCRRDECVPDGRLCQYGPPGEREDLPPSPTYTSATAVGANFGGTDDSGNAISPTSDISVYRPTFYGECCGNSQCIDGYCTPPQDECVEQGSQCGYGQTAVTALVPGASNYYGRCCDQMPCVDGVCQPPEEECNERGQFCQYGPQTFTANIQSPTYYGDCCADYQCVNGYCTPPGQTCVPTGGTCGYGTQYATTAAPPGTAYYGTCCQGDYCYNGRCTPEQGCSRQGETCVEGQIECCEGYECLDGRCVFPCMPLGDKCTYDSDCCQGTWCNDGVCSDACIRTVGSTCSDRRQCCEGMTCSNGRCSAECKTSGSCESDRECCEGYYCSDNRQCTEVPEEEEPTCQTSGSCAVGAAVCCEGYYCSANYYCTPCSTYGATCRSNDECCSPYACIQGYCLSATGAP